MKTTILISIFFACTLQLVAKSPRSGYVTVGYVKSELNKVGESQSLKSRYGMSISAGYTFFLNKEPILDHFYLGVDWTFLQGNFRQYRMRVSDLIPADKLPNYSYPQDMAVKNEIDHTSIGMQFGPSITMMPAKDWQVSTYFRYSPTLDFIETAVDPYNPPTQDRLGSYQESVDYSYVGHYSVGISASYKLLMIGAEYQWSTMQHLVNTSAGKQEIKFNNKGFWFNIGVRIGKKMKTNKSKNYSYLYNY